MRTMQKVKTLIAAVALGLASTAAQADLGSIHVSVYAGDVGIANPIHQTEVAVADNGCVDIYSAIPASYNIYHGGFGLYDHHIGLKFSFETNEPVPLHTAFYDARHQYIEQEKAFNPALNTLTLMMEERRRYQTRDIFNRLVVAAFTNPVTKHGFTHQNRIDRRAVLSPTDTSNRFSFEGITQRNCGLHFITLQNNTPVVVNKDTGIQFSPLPLASNFAMDQGSSVDLSTVTRGAKIGSQFVALESGVPLSIAASKAKPKDTLGIAFAFPAEELGVYRIIRRSAVTTLKNQNIGTPDAWVHVNLKDVSMENERWDLISDKGSSFPFTINESGLYHIRIVSHFEYRDRAPTLFGIFRPTGKFAEDAAHADFFMQLPDGRIEPITSDMMYIPKDAL